MKCWNSASNAQGLRLAIVVAEVGVVKMYVAAVEALTEKERQDETQFTQNWWFSEFHPAPWILLYFLAGFFENLTLYMTKLTVPVLCFPYFMVNSNAHCNRSAKKFPSHIYNEPQPFVWEKLPFLFNGSHIS